MLQNLQNSKLASVKNKLVFLKPDKWSGTSKSEITWRTDFIYFAKNPITDKTQIVILSTLTF